MDLCICHTTGQLTLIASIEENVTFFTLCLIVLSLQRASTDLDEIAHC